MILKQPSDLPKEYYEWFEELKKVINTKEFHKIGVYVKKLESFTPEELWKVTLSNMKTVHIKKGSKK